MQSKHNLREMIGAALFAALLAILAQIQIPMPSGVPVTLQTFGVALIGVVLGCKLGALSVLVYLMMGLVGLPVFAGLHGGFAILIGPTGGFLLGFIFMALITGLGATKRGAILPGAYAIAGLLCCHLCGNLFYCALSGFSLHASALVMTAPYIAKDVVSVLIAIPVGRKIRSRLAATG